MVSFPRLVGLAVVAGVLLGGPQDVDGRLILPTEMALQAFRHRAKGGSDSLATKISGYFQGSGFPLAGRSLQQKIRETEAFLAREIPKSGIVGTGVAVERR
jgi:hypothetical protein